MAVEMRIEQAEWLAGQVARMLADPNSHPEWKTSEWLPAWEALLSELWEHSEPFIPQRSIQCSCYDSLAQCRTRPGGYCCTDCVHGRKV